MHLSPPPALWLLSVLGQWFCCCWFVVDGYSSCGSLYCCFFCCTLLYVHSSFAIILMGKRELVALLGLSFLCLVIVVRLFLAVSWFCLQFVIMVFPCYTHFLFLNVLLSVATKRNNFAYIRSMTFKYTYADRPEALNSHVHALLRIHLQL